MLVLIPGAAVADDGEAEGSGWVRGGRGKREIEPFISADREEAEEA
jgi:hypothetical protein